MTNVFNARDFRTRDSWGVVPKLRAC